MAITEYLMSLSPFRINLDIEKTLLANYRYYMHYDNQLS